MVTTVHVMVLLTSVLLIWRSCAVNMHSSGCAVKMKQYVLFPFRTCISECIAIVFCDNLSMFDAYDGILMSICAFKLSVLKTVNKVCLAINCLTPTGASSVEQQHVTTLLYRLGAEAG